MWLLPGGYVFKAENLNEAASLILFERTGASDIYLQQLMVFSDLNRNQGLF